MPDLKGKVALVTGASRGVGRGIACSLGEAGAIVYVSGRSVRGQLTTEGLPGTIEDTADEVTARGGVGKHVRCDHTVDTDVHELFRRINRDYGRLDLLVNNAWGGYEHYDMAEFTSPFWQQPEIYWQRMVTAGVRAQYMANRFAVPMMLGQSSGMIVNISSEREKKEKRQREKEREKREKRCQEPFMDKDALIGYFG